MAGEGELFCVHCGPHDFGLRCWWLVEGRFAIFGYGRHAMVTFVTVKPAGFAVYAVIV